LDKVRPWWGHDYHFHVRIVCPSDSPDCKPQPQPPADDGCGHELDEWFTDTVLHPRPSPPSKPKPGLRMADLPSACRQVLLAPEAKSVRRFSGGVRPSPSAKADDPVIAAVDGKSALA